MFRDHLTKEKVKVRIEPFKSEKMPAMLIFDEQMQRMKAMTRKGAMADLMGAMPMEHTLVVNQNNPAIKNLLSLAVAFNKEEDVKMVVNQIYDLAWLQQGEFTADMMESFIERSSALLGKIGVSPTSTPSSFVTP
jgi:HSP90 family molecular chaperone